MFQFFTFLLHFIILVSILCYFLCLFNYYLLRLVEFGVEICLGVAEVFESFLLIMNFLAEGFDLFRPRGQVGLGGVELLLEVSY